VTPAPNILLADDHSATRNGIKWTLHVSLGITSVSDASSCSELMKALATKKYTHLIVDLLMSDGISLEILPNIRKLYPDLRIMVYSMQPSQIYCKVLRSIGISHYLPKTAQNQELIRHLNFLIYEQPVEESPVKCQETMPFSSLSARELEILHYLLNGMTTREISQTINLKDNTVSTVKAKIFIKTGADSLKDLIELARVYKIQS
jgi:DNA-binding NarL/FixJ family response regulator